MSALHLDAARRGPAAEAGGGNDWYDAFALADGRFALSIGEVVGPRLRAAILIDEVRGALRAAADPASPAAVLERANVIVNELPFPAIVSAIFGIVDPATATITYAAAGNPAPVLALPCALSQSLPAGEMPLGVARVLGATDWSFTIPPGAKLTLSSDGVQVFVTADDVLVRDLHFDFSAVPLAVPIARRTLVRYVERIGLDDESRFALITAVGEALANAVEHAYRERPGVVHLTVTNTPAAVCATIEDDGSWKLPQVSEERGRGLPIMRSLMDAVDVRTGPEHTTVRLTRYNSPRA